ncbi:MULTISPECIES: hypothetical protein [Streptomyces]|uniref:XRE family transcriptional regulator n=1 Tax=Streptomyces evansiae TaxID=3075535 RepID=A0ABU2R2G2_9ACTN|nr:MULTISPECIES: hypothetical protein [unclassified Streptomyces]MDT0409895.1 XRE family transcriptional regulator [Streptomyces sp. DSM 41979]MYQ60016.1 XRE family transcriptional regulator [Streptomyces sp. SID4926]SCD41376.1 hypothetical protein GA0115251_106959 [Streptomyces sp. TverLS-915]SCE40040.1 hypothetical protein GA0115252_14644 [Streptomyces sp. DfronAA-171]
MPKLLRKGAGQPLRDAMSARGLSGPRLAEQTRRVDPAGRGVSPATIGRLTGTGKTARDACEMATAWWIAEALDEPLQSLFRMPTHSTATVER